MKLDIPKDLPIAQLAVFFSAIEEARKNGYGKVVFEVSVQKGRVALVSVTRSESYLNVQGV